MGNFKCIACGAIFPSEEALKSHAKMKVTEESPHYTKMLAHGQIDPIYAGTQEKPS